MNKKVLLAIAGGILGLPLSYFFQSDIVKSKVGGFNGYLQNFGAIMNNSDLSGNVVLSVVIFAVIGLIIGYFIDKGEIKKD